MSAVWFWTNLSIFFWSDKSATPANQNVLELIVVYRSFGVERSAEAAQTTTRDSSGRSET
jgi:hypothetical protein